MQINSRTIVSVVATVSMVVMTVLLAVFSPPADTGQQIEPAANQAPIVSER
ncbi:hypothetical protein [Saccharopolyspora terrae]|jgi:hypothetical protein|uniref:hypothetical protein n=1 Tax=Saccharopolyspora terrae TaxID=2530384 RepID=UPI001404E2A1|nr:hypothetical protein [Saccharopolyspora terrae]